MENNLQYHCFIWANNTHKQGITWAVLNENQHHRLNAGVRKGVSDLHHYHNGVLSVAELKEPNSRHPVAHLRQQIRFIDDIIAQGGRGSFIYTLEQYKAFIRQESDFTENLERVRTLCTNAKTKTIKL